MKNYKDLEEINFDNITEEKIEIIKILKNDISLMNKKNYLNYNLNSDELVNLLNMDVISDNQIKNNFFKLSLTKKYDDDVRRRIIIDITNKKIDYFEIILNFQKEINILLNEINILLCELKKFKNEINKINISLCELKNSKNIVNKINDNINRKKNLTNKINVNKFKINKYESKIKYIK